MEFSYLDHRANLAGGPAAEDYVLGQGDIMLNHMHRDVVNPHVGIGMFHPVAVFLHQAVSTFYGGAEGLQCLVDDGIRGSGAELTVSGLRSPSPCASRMKLPWILA